MAPSAITEDYYMILEVDSRAAPELIVKSYKRLALKLHPDRNAQQDATEAFQRLSRAYETLRCENERRKYDLIYPSLKGRNDFAPYTREKATFAPGSIESETAQIAALRMSKEKRAAQWRISKTVFDTSISKAELVIRQLKQEIEGLISIAAAEAAKEAQRNSWSTWILSPIYKEAKDSDEVKAQKDRARQERRIERDMKERRMERKRAELNATKASSERSKTEFDTADLRDNAKIRELQSVILRKESWQRNEKERVEREKRTREMQERQEQQAKREREAAEARKRQQEAMHLAQQQREEEEARWWQNYFDEVAKKQEGHRAHRDRSGFTSFAGEQARQNGTGVCGHDGWWPKVQGRAACPQCHDSWTYLLQCPGCAMNACPKCQAAVRPRRPKTASGTGPRPRVRMRAPSPTFDYDDYY